MRHYSCVGIGAGPADLSLAALMHRHPYLHESGRLYHYLNTQFDTVPRQDFRNYLERACSKSEDAIWANYFPLEGSLFTNDYCTPSYSDYFARLDAVTRKAFNARNIITSDGISGPTLRLISHPAARLSRLALLTDAELHAELVEWNGFADSDLGPDGVEGLDQYLQDNPV